MRPEALTGRTRLPAELGTFVGRARDLATVEALVAEGARLVTIVGPGGMGKTRLALRWASASEPAFAGGAFFVDLSACVDDADFVSTVAAALDVPVAGAGPSRSVLTSQVRGHGRALIVLDNFEQLVAASAETVATLLRGAPEVTLVITSREPLRVRGEHVHELWPIGLPALDAAPSAIQESDGFRLLADHVRRVRGAFAPADAEVLAAAALLRRLDGIPLAIELAAARLDVLGIDALSARLDRGIDALGSGARDASARHRTLRAAIDWSLRLLDDEERAAFAETAVFRGGFDADAVEAVLTVDHPLERVSALRDKALIRSFDAPGLVGARRFAPYDTISAVARERLDLEPRARTDALRARHARHYAAAGGALRAQIDREGGSHAMRALALERGNLEAALEHVLGSRAMRAHVAELAVPLLFALEPVLQGAGASAAHLALADRVATLARSAPPATRARLSECRATSLSLLGRRAEALEALEAALALARKARDRALEGRLRMRRGRLSLDSPERALEDVRAALDLLSAAGEPRAHGIAANELAVRQSQLGQRADAEALFRKSLALFREARDRRWEGVTWCQLAILALDDDRLDAARASLFEASRLAAEDGWANIVQMSAQIDGHLAHLELRLDDALAAYDRARALHRRMANELYEGMFAGYSGIVQRERGQSHDAARRLDEACSLLAAVGEVQHRAIFLAHRGALLAWAGDEERARALFAEAAELVGGSLFHGVRDVVAIERVHLDLAFAARATDDHDSRTANAARKRALTELEATSASTGAHVAADVRVSARIARAALGEARAPVADDAPATESTFVIQREARWFRPPGGARVGLTSRHLARRLLLALVEARLATPGTTVSQAALYAVGWPGERVHPHSARNRLHVAMSTLRKQGLGAVIESEDDGYRLDPDVAVKVVD